MMGNSTSYNELLQVIEELKTENIRLTEVNNKLKCDKEPMLSEGEMQKMYQEYYSDNN